VKAMAARAAVGRGSDATVDAPDGTPDPEAGGR